MVNMKIYIDGILTEEEDCIDYADAKDALADLLYSAVTCFSADFTNDECKTAISYQYENGSFTVVSISESSSDLALLRFSSGLTKNNLRLFSSALQEVYNGKRKIGYIEWDTVQDKYCENPWIDELQLKGNNSIEITTIMSNLKAKAAEESRRLERERQAELDRQAAVTAEKRKKRNIALAIASVSLAFVLFHNCLLLFIFVFYLRVCVSLFVALLYNYFFSAGSLNWYFASQQKEKIPYFSIRD